MDNTQKVGFSLWKSFNLRQRVLLFPPRNMQECTSKGVVASKRFRHSHRWHISADYSGSVLWADTELRPLFCPGLHSVISWGSHILCFFFLFSKHFLSIFCVQDVIKGVELRGQLICITSPAASRNTSDYIANTGQYDKNI